MSCIPCSVVAVASLLPPQHLALAAVSVSVGAAVWPFLVLRSCSVSLPCVRAAALPLWQRGANEEEGVRLPPGLWVKSVSELSPWFCFCSQNGLGWLKQGRHLLMGLSLKEGRHRGSCGGCSGWQLWRQGSMSRARPAPFPCQQHQRHSWGLSSSSDTSDPESSSETAWGVRLSLGLGSSPRDPAPWALWEVSAQWTLGAQPLALCSATVRGGVRSWISNVPRVFEGTVGFVCALCRAAGPCPALVLAAITLLSQSLDRENTLSIWDTMRPSFLVYSSWQAKPCVMHGRGWERFLGSGTEARAGLSCSARWLPCPALSLRCWAGHSAAFPTWGLRTLSPHGS